MTRISIGITISGMNKAERNPYNIECGTRLRNVMEALGYTKIRAFADLTGEAEDNLGNWIRGVALVPPPYVSKLRELFGVTHDWIYHGDPSGLPHDFALTLLSLSSRR